MEKSAGPRVRHKEFRYHTRVAWVGGKAGMLGSDGKPDLTIASPPEFKGEEGVWTPEDLFVAAIEACMMTTFLAFAERKGLPLVSYSSRAEGLLEFVDGRYRFTEVTVRPRVLLEDPGRIAEAAQVLEEAHARCLVSNSVAAETRIEPEFAAAEPNVSPGRE